jgi:selenocysteine lyase/cysteine desulfurase
VRSGVSCCKLSPIPTNVNGAVRASFYIYNTLNDVDALINALKTYKKGDELANVL